MRAFFGGRHLQRFTLGFSYGTSAAAAIASFNALAACSADFVAIAGFSSSDRWADAEQQRATAAAAAAVCNASAVSTWRIMLKLRLLQFLRLFDARPPAAAPNKLLLVACEHEDASSELVPLLLRCLRSRPALQKLQVYMKGVASEVVTQLVAAVKAEPLTPQTLVAAVDQTVLDAYDSSELKRVGLQFSR
eukprot:PLAT2474.3.p2 GENE.PLAT2474.3~~PLAT2474.3.p2  ORF type:complete len:191 (-),score=62.51 PLAT2474.3:63-635(-)